MHVVDPKVVTLGAAGTMSVQRTIPTRGAHRIGAWVFVDHYAVHDVDAATGMNVGAHPHSGLQTASWVFTGTVEHRDSAGNHCFIKPGELNLMTAGRGISHSEFSTPIDSSLQGVQLWIALPEHARFIEPSFQHFVPAPLLRDGFTARVFLGNAFGAASPVTTHTPLLGVQLDIDAATTVDIELDATFEHGFLVDSGRIRVAVGDATVDAGEGQLVVVPAGAQALHITALAESRLVMLGGTPFTEPIIMWWNLIARTHDEVVAWRQQWVDEVAGTATTAQFGIPVDHVGDFEPVPEAPALQLKARV